MCISLADDLSTAYGNKFLALSAAGIAIVLSTQEIQSTDTNQDYYQQGDDYLVHE